MKKTLHNVTGIQRNGAPINTQAWNTTRIEAVAILEEWNLEHGLIAGYIATPATSELHHYRPKRGGQMRRAAMTHFEARP